MGMESELRMCLKRHGIDFDYPGSEANRGVIAVAKDVWRTKNSEVQELRRKILEFKRALKALEEVE